MMTPQRLWPVITALLAILGGAMGLEAAAIQRGTKTELIEIRDAASSDESDEDASDEEWVRTEPVSDEHARCRTLARRGEYAAAADLMGSVVATAPGNGTLLAEHGHLLRKAKRLEEALEVLERARAIEDSASIDLDEGLIFRRLDRAEDAQRAFARAAERRPHHTPTLLAYAASLRDAGKIDEALVILQNASQKGSNDERARALAALGRTLMEANKPAEAVRAFEQAIERAPAMTSVWLAAARALGKSERPEDLQASLRYALNATKLAPGLATAHGTLARTYEALNRPEEAIAAYERAIAVEAGYTFGLERLLRIHLDQEDYRAARNYAAQLMKADRHKREYLFLAGSVESAAGSFDAARDHFLAAIAASERPYPEAWYNLGIVERRLENVEGSIAAYRKAIELQPDYRAAWNNLGLSLADAGEFDEAEAAFKRAIGMKDDYVPAWSNLARMYADRERHAEAVEAYSRLVTLRPDDQGARMKLAIELRRAGRADEAIATYEELVRAQPRYVAAWYNLGIALAGAGRDAEAQKAYEAALALDPDHTRALKNVGLLLARGGQDAAAEARLLEYLDHEPSDDVARYRLAVTEKNLGKLAACAEEASRVLAHDATHERAKALAQECRNPARGDVE